MRTQYYVSKSNRGFQKREERSRGFKTIWVEQKHAAWTSLGSGRWNEIWQHFLVAERFLKSAIEVWRLVCTENRTSARKHHESLEKLSHPKSDRITRLPAIEGIFDELRTVHDSIIQFQNCHEPMLHQIFPNLQLSISDLERIESGEMFIGDSGTTYKPSLYAMKFCGVVRAELKRIHAHDLWLVACFLFSFLRDIGRNNLRCELKIWPILCAQKSRLMIKAMKGQSSRNPILRKLTSWKANEKTQVLINKWN